MGSKFNFKKYLCLFAISITLSTFTPITLDIRSNSFAENLLGFLSNLKNLLRGICDCLIRYSFFTPFDFMSSSNVMVGIIYKIQQAALLHLIHKHF